MKPIGVLGLQGGFQRHIETLESLGVAATRVRYPEELEAISGLILPGGESTTIGKLLERNGFLPPLRQRISDASLPIFATCAGLILLSDTIEESDQISIGGLPIGVRRNAYGSQVDSFELGLDISLPDRTISDFPGVFIRAPRISSLGEGVSCLAVANGNPVLVQFRKILAASFHPELSNSSELHEYFARSLCAVD